MPLALLKRHFIWILLGLILLVEGVFTFFLFGKQGEAAERKRSLEQKSDQVRKLQAKQPGDEKVLAILNGRKKAIVRERGECLLFFWDRAQALGRLFDDPTLIERDVVRPWQAPARMGVFLDSYQRVYNQEVEKLEPALKKLQTDRAGAGFVTNTAFTERTELLIGDVSAAQKDFWIRKEIITLAAKTGVARLESIEVKFPPPPPPGSPQALVAKPFDPVTVLLTVLCEYPVVGDFLAELHRSPLCFRIESAEKNLSAVEVRRWEKGGRERETKGGAAKKAGETAAEADLLVLVALRCIVPDFNVGIHQVKFDGAKFPRKANAVKWVDAEVARVERELKDKRGAERWLTETKAAIAAAQTAKTDVELADRLSGLEYDFGKQYDEALQWAREVPQYEVVRAEGRKRLLTQIRHELDAGAGEPKGGGITLVFRPKENAAKEVQFGPGQTYDQTLDADGAVSIEYGLVVYRPKAPGNLTRTKPGAG